MKRIAAIFSLLALTVPGSTQNRADALLFSSPYGMDRSWLVSDSVSVCFEDGTAILYADNVNEDTLNLADGNVVSVDFSQAFILTAIQDPDHAENYYATFYTSRGAYRVPDGGTANAYTGTADDNSISMTGTGGIIHRCEAVVLKASQPELTLMPSANSDTASATNVLKGTDAEIRLGEYDYALSYSIGKGIGFHSWNGQTTAANTAYLQLVSLPTPLEFFGLVFDDGTVTGAPKIHGRQPSGISHNLQGFEVDNGWHGIVIRDGRKFYNE